MLTIENIKKSYGDKLLFEQVNGTITAGDRIGLIGINGTGKSTLLKIVAGIEQPDHGTIQHRKDYRIEYLRQQAVLDPDLTVIEQIYYGQSTIMQVVLAYEMALQQLAKHPNDSQAQAGLLKAQQQMDKHDAWDTSTTAKIILTKLGITSFDQPVHALSGGQKKRIAIAGALIQPADLLILDEPTNHLDNETIIWLEKHLGTYKGALLMVTHDRYFLNRVTNTIFELDHGTLYTYEGNYELFLEKKATREALEEKEQQKHHNTLRRELAWLKRGARARSTKQKARIERVDQLQQQTFHTDTANVDIQVGGSRLGKQVLELTSVKKSFGEQVLFSNVDLLIGPHARIGIVGPSGAGKTTLLEVMAQRLEPDKGKILVGETVKFGYYTQGEAELDGTMRVIDYIKEEAEIIETKDNKIITAEQMLERFLFPRPAQWTKIDRLSGGEKRRLYLLKVLMTGPNVLLLDEPTNDLDTQTLGVLEEYLEHFPGVVITVSHDRYFLDRVVDTLLVFDGFGYVTHFHGAYSDYLEKQQEKTNQKQKKQTTLPQKETKQKKKLSYLEQREWETIEAEIMELETEVANSQKEIESTGSDFEKLQNLYEAQQQAEEKLIEKMERWETLSTLVEELEGN